MHLRLQGLEASWEPISFTVSEVVILERQVRGCLLSSTVPPRC